MGDKFRRPSIRRFAMKAHILQVIEDVLDSSEAVRSLLTKLKEGSVSDRERQQICSMLGTALVQEGLEPSGEPNAKGRLIEAAIDEVNRPILRRSSPNLPPNEVR